MQRRVIMAGFGGQGVMAMGQLLAYAAMLEGFQVTWMPSYGPEMRGGSANCSVILSDEPIGAPTISVATDLIAMNEPSYEKFRDAVKEEGNIFTNSSLFPAEDAPKNRTVYEVPCNEIARNVGMDKIANMVMLGAFLSVTKVVGVEAILKAFTKVFGDKKEKFIPINRQALEAGWDHLQGEESQAPATAGEEDFSRTSRAFSGETSAFADVGLFEKQWDAFSTDIDRLAWVLEQETSGRGYYQKMAEGFGEDPAALIFRSLAKQEKEHIDYLAALLDAKTKEKEWEFPQTEADPLMDSKQEQEVLERTSEIAQEVLFGHLQKAMQWENQARQFYEMAGEHCEDEDIKKLFLQLAYWENYHYEQLKGQADLYREAWWSNQSFSPM